MECFPGHSGSGENKMPKSTYSMLHLCKKEEDEINYTCICSFVQREYRQGKPETKKEQFPVGSRRENDGKKWGMGTR